MRKFAILFLLGAVFAAHNAYARNAGGPSQNHHSKEQWKFQKRNQAIEWPSCTNSGLTQDVLGTKTVNGQVFYVRRMATIFQEALDDFGGNASDDNLEIFCVSKNSTDTYGIIAMCLSGEACPWAE
jgi:hypothetical protein